MLVAERSEGVRRIVFILSLLFVFGWISWIGIMSDGFSGIKSIGWLIFAGGLIVAYLLPQLICKTSYWVMDGFKKDKET